MSASTIMDTLDSMIREELPALLMESLPGTDPVYTGMVRTNQDVTRDGIGRGWKIRHRFATSVSGLYEARPETGGTPYTTSTQSLFYNALQSFPNPTETPHVGNLVRSVTMNCHHGNFGVPTYALKAESLPASVVKDIMRDLKGLAEMRSQLEAVSFYSSSDKHIGTLSASGGSYTGTTHCTFTPGSSQARWFVNGMLLDFYDDADCSNKINVLTGGSTDVRIAVDGVDYLAGTVTVCSVEGTDISGTALYNTGALDSQTAYIFPRGAYQSSAVYRTGHYGLEDWIKESGTLFGDATAWTRTGNDSTAAFSLSSYPQFKSLLTTVSGPLTESVLNNAIGKLYNAYGISLDTMLTTDAVIRKHLEQPHLGAGRMNYDRDGKALTLKSGWASVSHSYQGREVDIKISPFCAPQTLWGLKMKNGNLKRYVPPRSMAMGGIGAPGTGIDLGDEIEFIAPMGGTSGIFKAVHDSNGRTTAMVEAPFQQYSQVLPVDVRGLKLSSLTEAS